MMSTSTRQLAAIMFTDIVGYTALMGQDSAKALELVRISKDIQKQLVEKHNGKWLKEMGDGAMAQFSTALDAVNCSIEIQKSARAELDAKLRIGIHLGDVTVEEKDVHGDGVNVASRLESITDPGGIYISDAIEKAIRGQTDIQAKYLGEVKLKNVAYGVRTYALQGVGLPVPEVKNQKKLSGHFLAELQRRGVLRAGMTFLMISLLLILLLPYGESMANLPEWTKTALITALLIGFPLAMYLAWNYERSPEGFIRTTSRESWQNPYSTSQRKPLTGNLIIAGLILVIIVMYTYPRYLSSEVGNPTGVYNPILGEKSIAVLPFENLSNDPEQEYFADGIHEDILNQLAKIADLQVKSRTSTLRYKGNTEKSMGDIGRELEVAHILEGSVRKAGNRVRINAQLIDVETNNHIWSEVYDRELTDIFAIQSEVAMEIAKVMKARLSPTEAENIGRAATGNITAYDYYLKGRQTWATGNLSDFDNVVRLLQQAIELDPQFAKAYAELAVVLYDGGFGLPSEIWLDSALVLANKAIEVNPEEPEGYLIRAVILEKSLRKLGDARTDLEKAHELDASNPGVIRNLGWNLIHTGEPERGAALLIEAIDLEWGVKDPQYYRDWGRIYFHIEEYDKAEALFLQAEKLDPGWQSPKFWLGLFYRNQGDYDKSIQYYESYDNIDQLGYTYLASGDLDMAESTWKRFYQVEREMEDTTAYIPFRHRLAYVNSLRGDTVEVRRLLEEQIRLDEELLERSDVSFWTRSAGSAYYDLAASKAFLGFREEALEIVEHPDFFWGNALQFSYQLNSDPLFEPIRDEPRFKAVADKWRDVSQAVKDEYRKQVREREASEQLKLALDK